MHLFDEDSFIDTRQLFVTNWVKLSILLWRYNYLYYYDCFGTGGVAIPGAVVGILVGGQCLRQLNLTRKGL